MLSNSKSADVCWFFYPAIPFLTVISGNTSAVRLEQYAKGIYQEKINRAYNSILAVILNLIQQRTKQFMNFILDMQNLVVKYTNMHFPR